MNSLALLTRRPIWNCLRREGYWRKSQCSTTCSGHIVPFNKVHEAGIFSQPFRYIDYKEWDIARGQEFLAYEELINPSTEEGVSTEVEKSPPSPPVQEIDQAQSLVKRAIAKDEKKSRHKKPWAQKNPSKKKKCKKKKYRH